MTARDVTLQAVCHHSTLYLVGAVAEGGRKAQAPDDAHDVRLGLEDVGYGVYGRHLARLVHDLVDRLGERLAVGLRLLRDQRRPARLGRLFRHG